jgi:hypothetical protein
MTHKGLGDDVIIARINASPTKFDLSDDDLAALKKAGVSDAVVAAMIQSTQLTVAKVKIDGNPVELRVIPNTRFRMQKGCSTLARILALVRFFLRCNSSTTCLYLVRREVMSWAFPGFRYGHGSLAVQ